jgi:hypothetical protein
MSSWAPTLLVIIETAIALTWASSPPATAIGRRWWMAGLFVVGSLAIAASVWQGRGQAEEPAALTGTTTPAQAYTGRADGSQVSELTRQVKALQDRVRELENKRESRTISQDTAENFASYLKQFGRRRVIISCIPDDMEAYRYANQLVNLFRAGDWDVVGPEVTKIFGDIRGLGINVYVNRDDNSDTAKVLLDGFAKFNIPYQSRVTPSRAIPDAQTVELFIGMLPSRVDSAHAE